MSEESKTPGAEAQTPVSATQALSQAVAKGRLMDGFAGEVAVTVMAFIFAFILGALLMVLSDQGVMQKFTYFFAQPSAALGAAWAKIGAAYGALVVGAVGSWPALAETTAQAAPLICAGLGVALAFRVGLFNIGGQGQAIWGAIGAGFVGFHFHMPAIIHLPLAILAGIVCGAIWSGIAGILRARFGAHEVIVTIMLNYVASGLLLWLLYTPLLQRPGRQDPISPIVDQSAWLPTISQRLNVGFFLALLAAVAVWWILDHTRLGFSIRAVGANSEAAATAGMSVPVTLTLAMVISGILCGLGGVQVALAPSASGAPTALAVGVVGNIGFNAITVALLGRSRPLGVVLAGLLFGALQAGGLHMQAAAQTPSELADVLQAFIVMFVAAPMLVKTLAPFLKSRAEKKRKPTAKAEVVPSVKEVAA